MQKESQTFGFITPFLIFCSSFAVYLLTLSQSVYPGDSGEFITVAKNLGIAHPPGYPLYTLLAHLFTYIPLGNTAIAVNLFSALTSSLTVVVVYYICLKLTKNRLASASASLLLAFSYSYWLYSLVAEVRSLHGLFIALLILIATSINENRDNPRLFWLQAFIFGLALTNHYTVIFLAPALLIPIISANPKIFLKPKFIIPSLLFFLIGLLPYLYFPLRAAQNPVYNWGDPDTPAKFLNHVMRLDYGGATLGAGTSQNPFNFDILLFYFKTLLRDYAYFGAALGLLGIAYLPKNNRLLLFPALAFLLLGPIFILVTKLPITGNIENQAIIEKVFPASYVVFTLFIAVGLSVILGTVGRLKYIFALAFLLPLVANHAGVNQSKNTIYEKYGQQLFENLPQDSIFLVAGDTSSMISIYRQQVEDKRPDIRIVNFTLLAADWYKENLKQRYPELQLPWDKFTTKTTQIEAAKTICTEVVPKNTVFIDNWLKEFTSTQNPDCSYIPSKTIIRLKEKNTTISNEEITENLNFWRERTEALIKLNPPDLRTKNILQSYSTSLSYLGAVLDDTGKKEDAFKAYQDAWDISQNNPTAAGLIALKYNEEKDFDKAILWDEKSLSANPKSAQIQKELGLLYLEQKNDKKKAYSHLQIYLHIAPETDDTSQIENLVDDIRKQGF